MTASRRTDRIAVTDELIQCGTSVFSDHQAVVLFSVCLGAYKGIQYLKLYGDNLSWLVSAKHGRAATGCMAQNRLLRQYSTHSVGLAWWLNCCR